AALGLDAVDEVEPVALPAGRSTQARDRLHEASAVPRRDLEPSFERLDRSQPRGHAARVEHLRPTVAGHPQRRRPVLARAAATGGDEREHEDGEPLHRSAFERIAPSAVARTSRPLCAATHVFFPICAVAVVLVPTWSTRFWTGAGLPLSL